MADQLSDFVYCLQIEITKTYGPMEWRDDLRKVMRLAGEANKKVGVCERVVYCCSAEKA